MERPFEATQADQQILQDDSRYRVYDITGNPLSSSRASYFHNSIGGYHGAKPGRIQELFDFYIASNNMEILNMLNVKYFIVPTEEGVQAQQNPNNYGNAWFVENVEWVNSANEEILALKEVDLQNTAVINEDFKDILGDNVGFNAQAQIELVSEQPNELVYKTSSNSEQLAVFSESYYQPGWQAYIDGEEVPHAQVNYVLRAMNIPAGDHTVTFSFEPEVINTGSQITLASSIILALSVLGGIFYGFKRKKKKEE
jgi:LPXTG-motif cell wall-anchored protein